MSHTQLRSVPADELLSFARRQLLERRSFAADRERERLDEALKWIDGGVYGGCSVCGCALDPEQIMQTPEQMCCPRCLRTARHADSFWSTRRYLVPRHSRDPFPSPRPSDPRGHYDDA